MNETKNPTVTCEVLIPTNELQEIKEIERSIIKKYRSVLWSKFVKAINEYDMIQDGDKIAVCISGGKDSLLLAKMFQELKKHGKQNFEVEYIAMDPGFDEANLAQFKKNIEHLQIPVKIKESGIFAIVNEVAKDYPCYLCARMRRGFLYNYAQELGCNKIALGHHKDDIIETTLINLFYAGNFKTMMPKLKATNFEGMELIRPLCLVEEKDIINYTQSNGIISMSCGCVVAAGKTSSKRRETKNLIKELSEKNPILKKSIYEAANNVNLNAILGYQKDGVKHSFLDDYADSIGEE